MAAGSMSPSPCIACPHCGTNLMGGEVVPHKFVPEKVETDEGEATLSRCYYCMDTKKEIEKFNLIEKK